MKPRTVGRPPVSLRAATRDDAAQPSYAGLISGAQLLTLNGELSVDVLRVGDHILTRSGAVPIRRIDVVSALVPSVYVIAGSLGHSRTDRDALLSADQLVFLRDWRAAALSGQRTALLQARALVDGEFVRDVGLQLVTLYRIYCQSPQILFADGLDLGTADTAPDTTARPVA